MAELQTKPIKKKMILHIDLIYWQSKEMSREDIINLGIGTKKGIEWEIFRCIGDYLPISYIHNWEEVKPVLDEQTEEGMPLGDYAEQEFELMWQHHNNPKYEWEYEFYYGESDE